MSLFRLTVLLSFCCVGLAHAEFENGNDMFEKCKSYAYDQNNYDSIFCIGFVAGAHDGIFTGATDIVVDLNPKDSANIRFLTDNWLGICMPNGVKLGQVVDIFIQYLANNPGDRHYTASSLLATALKDTFPCKGVQ